MSDRLVVYKTQLQRCLEVILIGVTTAVAAVVWNTWQTGISVSYAVVLALLLSYLVIPPLGARIAQRRGGLMMTAAERSRRYLDELGPIGLASRPGAYPAATQSRRGTGRSGRRG